MRHTWISLSLLAVAVGCAAFLLTDSRHLRVDASETPSISDSNADKIIAEEQPAVTVVAHTRQSNETEEKYYAGYSADISFKQKNVTARMPYSATERAMLSDGMINDTAIKALENKNFNQMLTRFEEEQGGMTGELTAAYRAVLENSLDSISAAKKIDRLVCGTDLCIASIRSPTQEWYDGWFKSVQRTSALPMNSLTGNVVSSAGSSVEYRVLFSTTPQVRGFAGSAPSS